MHHYVLIFTYNVDAFGNDSKVTLEKLDDRIFRFFFQYSSWWN